jgi:benzil reductase ((S)-benzoin forming)
MQRHEHSNMKVAIVTGVSRGLGEALAVALLGRGFLVLGIGRRTSPRLSGEAYRFVACDLSHPSGIRAALEPSLTELAEMEPDAVTLINNAAIAAPVGVVGRLDAAHVEAAIATNVTAPLVVADLFLRTFPSDSVERRIINVSSGAAQTALAGGAVYGISKAAIEMLTTSLAADHTAPGFRAITLRPGIFETGMQQFMRSHDRETFPSVDLFREFKDRGILKDPGEVAARVVERLVEGPVDHGRTYSHVDLQY